MGEVSQPHAPLCPMHTIPPRVSLSKANLYVLYAVVVFVEVLENCLARPESFKRLVR